MAANGRQVSVRYTADENGYQAKVLDKLSNDTLSNADRLGSNVIKTLLGGG